MADAFLTEIKPGWSFFQVGGLTEPGLFFSLDRECELVDGPSFYDLSRSELKSVDLTKNQLSLFSLDNFFFLTLAFL